MVRVSKSNKGSGFGHARQTGKKKSPRQKLGEQKGRVLRSIIETRVRKDGRFKTEQAIKEEIKRRMKQIKEIKPSPYPSVYH